jgi:asparagine synthase (glutamine-hydrolysing)
VSSGRFEALEEELLSRLRTAVQTRLVADVPVGAFLSGGIDSASVVALMAESGTAPVRTFSIGFQEATHDELPYARQVAARFGTEHHEFVVKADAAEVLPKLVHHYNEPFADSSALPTYYVSKMTRAHVTVALSGDGGDESFAGYGNYAEVLDWDARASLPWRLCRRAAPALAAAYNRLPYQDTVARAGRALTMLSAPVDRRFELQTSIFKPLEKQAAYTRQFAALAQGGSSRVFEALEGDPLAWMMRHDQQHYLPDCLMTKVDVASMANSLEVRSPLLDHEFVEFAATIPTRLKFADGRGKVILRRAMGPLLPPEVLERRKTGFGLPVAKWFAGPLQPMLRDTLLADRAVRRNLFQPAFVRHMIESHAAGRRDWSHRLWALLFLELWFREFID